MYAARQTARRRSEFREEPPAPLTLASALGNQAFARFAAARRALAREPVEAPAAPALDVDALAIDLMTGGTKKRRISSDVALQTWWPDLKKDLLAKPNGKGAMPSSRFTPLRTPERAEAFAAMTDEQRL